MILLSLSFFLCISGRCTVCVLQQLVRFLTDFGFLSWVFIYQADWFSFHTVTSLGRCCNFTSKSMTFPESYFHFQIFPFSSGLPCLIPSSPPHCLVPLTGSLQGLHHLLVIHVSCYYAQCPCPRVRAFAPRQTDRASPGSLIYHLNNPLTSDKGCNLPGLLFLHQQNEGDGKNPT